MKRVVLFFMVIGLTAMSAFGQKRETRPASGFTGVDASGAFDMSVARGDTESLVIEADDDVMPYVRSEVKNGVLRLYLDHHEKVKHIKTLKAFIVMKNLDMVMLSGACKFTASDLFTPDRFKSECSGASNMTVHVHTGQLSIDASGASKIRLKANITGDARLDVSGASNVHAELEAANVKLNSSGANSITFTGSATDMKIDLSGTSKVNAEDFTVKTATVKSSGVGNVIVNVRDTLKVNASGASFVRYKGSPSIERNNSGVAIVKSI